MVRAPGLEPGTSVWKTVVLPIETTPALNDYYPESNRLYNLKKIMENNRRIELLTFRSIGFAIQDITTLSIVLYKPLHLALGNFGAPRRDRTAIS